MAHLFSTLSLWRGRILALALLVTAAWYFGTPILLGPEVPAATVIQGDLVASVVASGNVAAPFRVNIGSQITGVVADVPVDEGQTVKKGDLLIRLDDREAQAAVVQLQGALDQADARLRQLRELTLPAALASQIEAQATVTNAQKTFDRAASLSRNGYETQANLDAATKELNIARAQLRNAGLVVFTNTSGGSDYVMAETQRNQAQANLAAARSRLSYTTLSAPRDGVLIARNVERGFVVQPNNILMVLSPFDDTQLVVQIDEKNLGRLALGQHAVASADAYPDQHFAADIIYINPGIDISRASVQVKLRVPDPPAYLRQDMTVSIDIETARHNATSIVPLDAVHDLVGGHPWVLKIADGRAHRQQIQTGIVSAGRVEVTGGLVGGDKIITLRNDVADGARVRTAP